MEPMFHTVYIKIYTFEDLSSHRTYWIIIMINYINNIYHTNNEVDEIITKNKLLEEENKKSNKKK